MNDEREMDWGSYAHMDPYAELDLFPSFLLLWAGAVEKIKGLMNGVDAIWATVKDSSSVICSSPWHPHMCCRCPEFEGPIGIRLIGDISLVPGQVDGKMFYLTRQIQAARRTPAQNTVHQRNGQGLSGTPDIIDRGRHTYFLTAKTTWISRTGTSVVPSLIWQQNSDFHHELSSRIFSLLDNMHGARRGGYGHNRHEKRIGRLRNLSILSDLNLQ